MRRTLVQTLLLFFLGCACYAQTLGSSFIQDDNFLILNNPLLNSWSSLPTLLRTGYWEAWAGSAVGVHEFRPLTVLSFFLQVQTTGHSPWPFHLVNMLFHGACAAALFALLNRILSTPRIALWASILFAAHPAHVEAVAHISGRSELLAALWILLCWKSLMEDRAIRAAGFFCLGLLSKESAAVFPAAWLLFDWVRRGKNIRRRWASHAGLWAILVLYLAARAALLPHIAQGGRPYFSNVSAWVKWLTLSKFWCRYYLVPMVTGANWGLDFKRPFFPDAIPFDPAAILLLLSWTASLSAGVWACCRRRWWGFWTLFAALGLLPTAQIVFELDTIGAERFLYIPSVSFCVAVAAAVERPRIRLDAKKALFIALAAWYAVMTFQHNKTWRDSKTYYSAVLEQNPASATATFELGLAHVREGRLDLAESSFRQAIVLDRQNPAPFYNLGKLLLEEGKEREAESAFQDAYHLDPRNPDILIFMAILREEKNPERAVQYYREALEIKPWDPIAHFNLGRLCLTRGMTSEARSHWQEFLRLAPRDPKSPRVRELLRRLPR